jgi:hypothetical protein
MRAQIKLCDGYCNPNWIAAVAQLVTTPVRRGCVVASPGPSRSHARRVGALGSLLLGRFDAATEQKYPVLLEYAKASLERIKQRPRHL